MVLVTLAAAAQLSGCLAVSGDHITVGRLAETMPEFAAADPEERLGYTPNPGARRTFRANDIKRVGGRLGVAVANPRDVCFEWQLRELTAQEVEAAMRKALDNPQVNIELIEFSRQPIPQGEVVFDPARLPSPVSDEAAQPVAWNGFIEYGRRRRFTVWARVRLTATMQRLVAARPIRAGARIERADVRVETYEGFPRNDAPDVAAVIGQVSVRPLQEGMVIPSRLLREAPLIKYGDRVSVVVSAGRAVIKTEGRAEDTGKMGETIDVRNLKSGRIFKGKVIGSGQVAVVAPGG